MTIANLERVLKMAQRLNHLCDVLLKAKIAKTTKFGALSSAREIWFALEDEWVEQWDRLKEFRCESHIKPFIDTAILAQAELAKIYELIERDGGGRD